MPLFWIIFIIVCSIAFGLLMWALCAVGKRGDHSSEGEPRDE